MSSALCKVAYLRHEQCPATMDDLVMFVVAATLFRKYKHALVELIDTMTEEEFMNSELYVQQFPESCPVSTLQADGHEPVRRHRGQGGVDCGPTDRGDRE